MTTEKGRLRRVLRQRRAGLSYEESKARSSRIFEQLKGEVDWSRFKQIHCYSSLPSEVATIELISWLQRAGCGVSIPSQKAIAPIPADLHTAFDLVVVPMLGFDASLHRIGYGGGYYDRLLTAHPDALKVGLCFEIGRVGKLPAQSHDVQLDIIITEDRVYRR